MRGFSSIPKSSPLSLKVLLSPPRLAFSTKIFFSAKPKNLLLIRESARLLPTKLPMEEAIFWNEVFPSSSSSGIVFLTVETMSCIEETDIVPVRGLLDRGLVLDFPFSSKPVSLSTVASFTES